MENTNLRTEIINDLKNKYGEKYLLSPAELALIINKSVAAQANMRSTGTFPIKVVKIGKKIGISVYDVADFLVSGQLKEISKTKIAVDTAKITTKITKKRGARDWLLAFEQSVNFQQNLLSHLHELRLKEIVKYVEVHEIKKV